MIFFIMLMIVVYKVFSLYKYRNCLSILFVLIVGFLVVFVFIYSMIK